MIGRKSRKDRKDENLDVYLVRHWAISFEVQNSAPLENTSTLLGVEPPLG